MGHRVFFVLLLPKAGGYGVSQRTLGRKWSIAGDLLPLSVSKIPDRNYYVSRPGPLFLLSLS